MGNFLGLFRTRNENRVKRVGGTLYLRLVCFLVVLVCLFGFFFHFSSVFVNELWIKMTAFEWFEPEGYEGFLSLRAFLVSCVTVHRSYFIEHVI